MSRQTALQCARFCEAEIADSDRHENNEKKSFRAKIAI